MNPTIRFKRLHPNAIIPEYKTAGAAGMDLHWDGLNSPRPAAGWAAGFSSLIHLGNAPVKMCTGIALELPEGFEAQIRGRSSLSAKGILCHTGTIDQDYTGELIVVLQDTLCSFREHAPKDHVIHQGDRIAQLVISPVARCIIQVAEDLSTTERGSGGFGSTGR